jgi:hypothetical protein
MEAGNCGKLSVKTFAQKQGFIAQIPGRQGKQVQVVVN